MSTPKPRIKLDKKEAKKGDLVEVKTLISHVMESGQRRDSANEGSRRAAASRQTCHRNARAHTGLPLRLDRCTTPPVALTSRFYTGRRS